MREVQRKWRKRNRRGLSLIGAVLGVIVATAMITGGMSFDVSAAENDEISPVGLMMSYSDSFDSEAQSSGKGSISRYNYSFYGPVRRVLFPDFRDEDRDSCTLKISGDGSIELFFPSAWTAGPIEYYESYIGNENVETVVHICKCQRPAITLYGNITNAETIEDNDQSYVIMTGKFQPLQGYSFKGETRQVSDEEVEKLHDPSVDQDELLEKWLDDIWSDNPKYSFKAERFTRVVDYYVDKCADSYADASVFTIQYYPATGLYELTGDLQYSADVIDSINYYDGTEPYVQHIGKDKAWAPYSMSFTMFSTGALAPQKQEETTTAEKEKDDPTQNEVKEKDEGTTIHNDIVEGRRQDSDDDGNPLLPLVIGGVAVGGFLASRKKKKKNKDNKPKDKKQKEKKEEKPEEEEERDPVEYKMIVYKEFGDTLKVGETQWVYARIEEYKPIQNIKRTRDDLTAQITCYSDDGQLIVEDAGNVVNGCAWRAAKVTVPESVTKNEVDVTFKFTGAGGEYIRHVMFKVARPLIIFNQENLGLPANRLKNALPDPENKDGLLGDQEINLPFLLYGMTPEETRISFEFKFDYTTDVNGKCIEGPLDKKSPIPYELTLLKDAEKNKKGVYEINIKETADYEMPAGTTEGFRLTIIAECGQEGKEGYVKIEQPFPIFRIHLGIVFVLETDSIPCYMQVKPDRVKKSLKKVTTTPRTAVLSGAGDPAPGVAMATGVDVTAAHEFVETNGAAKVEMMEEMQDEDEGTVTAKDIEPVYGEGSIVIFMYRKKDLSIVRAPAYVEYPEGQVGHPLKLTMKKLENDRWCRTGDKEESHQKLIDDLGIVVQNTNKLTSSGAQVLRFVATKSALDAPQRFTCEMEFQVKYADKTYTIKHDDVLLRSQPFRTYKDEYELNAFMKNDEHIEERLVYIQSQIRDYALYHLGSVYNLIDRMVEGYDVRFGYDGTQVANVQRIWLGWINKTYTGSNGTPQGVTLADDIAAGYAFLQGLRDNTGVLGRVAMGVMSAGYSEYLFSTITLAEEMKKKVFECHGDKDFGFWDAIQMGVKEFSTQILMEAAIGGIKFGNGTKTIFEGGFRIPGIAEIGGEYMLKVHNIDVAGTMKMWATRYRTAMDKADTWLKVQAWKGKNFFNSSAKQLKAGIENTSLKAQKAAYKTSDMVERAKNSLSADDLAERALERQAMADGMKEVKKLQRLQQDMESVTGDAKLLKEAKEAYRLQANVVMKNKNALKQLQRLPGGKKNPYADRMRAQFNEYRENLFDDVQRRALKDVADEIGRPVDELYVMNVSNGSNKAYKQGLKVPGDRDISFKQKVFSDKSGYMDLTIDQELGKRAVARRLYKMMNGKEAETIEEAIKFMKECDVTYVNPNTYEKGAFVHNLDGYEDLMGMVGMVPDPKNPTKMIMNKELLKNNLHNKVINQKSVWHKGVEWFETDAKASLAQAAKLEANAANAVGKQKDLFLLQAREFRNMAHGQTIEGIRQISKQVDNIIDARHFKRTGVYLTEINDTLMELQTLAKQLDAGEIELCVFKKVLRDNYKMDLMAFADYVSKCLD